MPKLKSLLRDLLNRSAYRRHIATLMSGTALAQLISFALIPVITRLYQAEDFGLFGIYLAIVMVLTVIMNGGYELAIMLPEKDEDAYQLFGVSLLFTALISFIVLPGVLWTRVLLAELLNSRGFELWILFLPVSLLIEGSGQACRIFLNKLQYYKTLSVARILRALLTGAGIVLIGLIYSLPIGLLLGYLLGQLVFTMILLIKTIQWRLDQAQGFDTKQMKQLAFQYLAFPKYSVLGTWLNTASRQLPLILLPFFFGKEVAGFFVLTYRVMLAPVALVSQSISEVFYEKATVANTESELSLANLTRSTAKFQFWLGIFPVIAVVLFGPQLFGFIFGEAWEISGTYAQWLGPWILVMAIASPLSYLVDIKNKLPVQLVYNMFLLLVRTAALFWGSVVSSALVSVMAFGISSFILVFLYSVYLLQLAGVFSLNLQKTR